MEITELICILNVVRYAVFVVTFTVYAIRFPPTVSRTLISCFFCVCTSTAMRDYVAMCLSGIVLRATKQIVFVLFFNFPGNPSASRPNYFEYPVFQRSLVSLSFY